MSEHLMLFPVEPERRMLMAGIDYCAFAETTKMDKMNCGIIPQRFISAEYIRTFSEIGVGISSVLLCSGPSPLLSELWIQYTI